MNASITIEPQQHETLTTLPIDKRSLTLADQAKQIAVVDQQTYDSACDSLKTLKQLSDEIITHHADAKRKAHEAHKAVCDAEKKMLQPVQAAIAIVGASVARWEAEQRRIQQELEQRQREALALAAAEEIEAAAVEAESQNASLDEVRAIIEQPVIVPRVNVAPTYERSNGISTAERFTSECYDVRSLCAAISAGKQPVELILKFDEVKGRRGIYTSPALNRLATALKKSFNIPGCRAVPVHSVRIGGR